MQEKYAISGKGTKTKEHEVKLTRYVSRRNSRLNISVSVVPGICYTVSRRHIEVSSPVSEGSEDTTTLGEQNKRRNMQVEKGSR